MSGVWDRAASHPFLYAAGIPMSGGGNPTKADLLYPLPIWDFHAAQDGTVLGSTALYEAE